MFGRVTDGSCGVSFQSRGSGLVSDSSHVGMEYRLGCTDLDGLLFSGLCMFVLGLAPPKLVLFLWAVLGSPLLLLGALG